MPIGILLWVLSSYSYTLCIFALIYFLGMSREQVNRLKIVLAEEQKSNKWLAEQLGKDQATISKWVTNASQPDLKNLLRIAKALNVDVARLLNTEVVNDDEI